MAGKLYDWFDARLKLKPIGQTLLDEPIPGGASWIYVFGSATLFLFCLQATTGMFLALYYVPSPDAAYDTVQFIQHEVLFGWFVRGLHHWGASAVMVAIGLHLLQVYLYGAYKRPREVMWMVGIVLLLLMLTFGFTGYLLPWDQNAYWATQVGTNMVASVPFVGDILVRLLRGGESLGALTLSRFFALHTLFLPSLIVGGILLHLFILRRVGPAGPWNEEEARQRSETFYPRQVYMDAVVMLGLFLILAVLAGTIEFPLADRADPADHTFTPVPEWYFLFFYQLLKYMSGPLEPLATWGLPILVILGLLLLPFLDRNKERRPRSRPVAVFALTMFLVTIFALLGISIRDLHALPKVDPSLARGKVLFAQHHCLACHSLHGEGGKVGPDLSYVGDRRTDRDWHIRHLRDPASVSPGSIMPKFPLSDREVNDLASFLLSLKGAAAAPTKGALETEETEYAAVPSVGVAWSCPACVRAEERKELI
jgi:ubiquinol-cytochrome c reductase cytochrome b subunit